MKFRNLIFLLFFTISVGCAEYKIDNLNKLNLKTEKKYKNSGFALVYNENLDIKNFDNRSLQIFHKNLKKNSLVKITNPINNKSLIAEIKSNKVEFSNFYNSIISSRIAGILDIDLNEPFIEIILISKDSTFIAKKAKTFEEEKEVAEKAPIDGIMMVDLSNKNQSKSKQKFNKKFSYSIKVADFYYKKTAQLMVDRIKAETLLKNLRILEISKKNYRVLIGPYNDIKTLQESFEKMNSLYFENLEILKNV